MEKRKFLKRLASSPRLIRQFMSIQNSLCPECRAKLTQKGLIDDPKEMKYCDKCEKIIRPMLDKLEKKFK